MDKYEYKLKLDQMKSLTAEHNYEKAAEIADTINWNKIKNVNALVKVGEIYENTGRLEDSREVLLMAYDRSPIGRMIIYRLAKVAIKMKNFDEAKDYYQEFVEIAPHDNLKYVLKYEICKAQGANIETLIGILEELKEQEYTEEWAFELACLYHKAGMADKCVEACDELVLWFGDGPYVERALELKMIYQPLNKQQEEKYRRFCQKREGVVEVRPEEELDSGEIVNETVQIPDVKLSPERFNTQNLQEELQKSMQQIMHATEKETVTDSMDNIKKLVEEIPYLQLPKEEYDPSEEEEDTLEHIETDHEIDDSLKINFKELLAEEHDGQIGMYMPEKTALEHQITGQMSIEEVLAEWEKTKYAAEVALEDAKQRRLESAKARALQEAEEIMGRLADIIPKLDAGVAPKDILQDQYIEGKPLENDRAAAMVANMNQILQEEIDRISTETADIDKQLAEAAGTAASAMEPEPAASMGVIDSYKSYVKPDIGIIDTNIEMLTGIRKNMVQNAPGIRKVLENFAGWFPDDVQFVTWSENDEIQIKREIEAKHLEFEGKDKYYGEWYDCQKTFSEIMNDTKPYKLEEALNLSVFEFSCFDCCAGFLLACCCKFIKLFSCESPLFCYILSSDSHVIVIECIPKCVIYHCIDHRCITHSVSITCVFQCIWSHRHIFHTACYNDISISCLDHLCSHVHTVKSGSANNVNRNCRCLDRKTCF